MREKNEVEYSAEASASCWLAAKSCFRDPQIEIGDSSGWAPCQICTLARVKDRSRMVTWSLSSHPICAVKLSRPIDGDGIIQTMAEKARVWADTEHTD